MAAATGYTIRRARPAELDQLPAIEHAAAAQFRTTVFAALADAPLSTEELDPAHDHIWVAVDSTDAPVGFALVHRLATVAHLHELDVHPAHARRGLGGLLIETVADWAKGEGLRAITLTTFRDIPWNGPYYARIGFRPLATGELSAELRAISAAEAAAGLPVAGRVCMRRDLG